MAMVVREPRYARGCFQAMAWQGVDALRRCAGSDQTALQYELIVGFTRLGNILGSLDRQDVPESAQHTIWLGMRAPS
jgi:hypothetical protein